MSNDATGNMTVLGLVKSVSAGEKNICRATFIETDVSFTVNE